MSGPDDLPLFHWAPPPCRMLPFPLARRVGRIRDVALKLSEKTTERHTAYYRLQVTEGLRSHLTRLGIATEDQEQEIAMFWSCVCNEMNRLATHHHDDQGGEAS